MRPVSKITAVKGRVCALSGPGQGEHALPAKPGRPLLDRLRGQIARIEQKEPKFAASQVAPGMTEAPSAPWCFDLAGVDRHLPAGELSTSAVHEVAGATFGEMPAAMGFALALAVRLQETAAGGPRPVLWCRHASLVSP